VVYNSVAERPWRYVRSQLVNHGLNKPFILYPGGPNLVKEPHVIIEAYELIGPEADLDLYITSAKYLG